MNKTFVSLVISILLLLAPVALLAQPGPGRTGGFNRQELIKKLGLNQQQKQAIKEFRDRKDDLKVLDMKVKTARLELQNMIKHGKASEAQIMKQVEKVNNLMSELNRKKVANILKLRAELSPEQFEKIINFIEHQKKSGQFGQHGFGRAGGMQQRRGPVGRRMRMGRGQGPGLE
ncbi:MAG: hypothetical protein D6719_07885 [Candidatus Dadabacteria bacterium]|nr:MAG: hypothetical protein D6719_07885 [Candidatus Dadabacteria bacterium]